MAAKVFVLADAVKRVSHGVMLLEYTVPAAVLNTETVTCPVPEGYDVCPQAVVISDVGLVEADLAAYAMTWTPPANGVAGKVVFTSVTANLIDADFKIILSCVK